jgi:hypothetical protein
LPTHNNQSYLGSNSGKLEKAELWRMGWFRTNRGGVAWLAFFALACQFFLSFGHVHVGKFTGADPVAWAVADSNSSSPAVAPLSPQQRPTRLAVRPCAICVNINIASALLLVDAPAVTRPTFFFHVLPWPLPTGERVLRHFPFSARGPPDA